MQAVSSRNVRRKRSLTLPLFDLVVCCSGMDDKDHWHEIIEHLGGRVSREMDPTETTHLVCEERQGLKYKTALEFKSISIVTPQWLTDCKKQNRRLDETKYLLSTINYHQSAPDAPSSDALNKKMAEFAKEPPNSLFQDCQFCFWKEPGTNRIKNSPCHMLIRRGMGTIRWEATTGITHTVVPDGLCSR